MNLNMNFDCSWRPCKGPFLKQRKKIVSNGINQPTGSPTRPGGPGSPAEPYTKKKSLYMNLHQTVEVIITKSIVVYLFSRFSNVTSSTLQTNMALKKNPRKAH